MILWNVSVDVEAAASSVNLHPQTLRRWIKTGDLVPSSRVPLRVWTDDVAEVAEKMAARRRAPLDSRRGLSKDM